MTRFLNRFGVVAVIAVAALGFSAKATHADPSPFPSVNCEAGQQDQLQDAIDRAPYGSAIFFGGECDNGPYQIAAGKFIRLVGFSSGGTLSAPGSDDCVLSVFDSNIWLMRLTVDATGNPCGVRVSGNSNLFTTEGQDGDRAILVTGSDGAGIIVERSSDASLNDLTVSDNGGTGISVEFSSSVTLGRATITGNDVGVLVDTNSSAILFGGDFGSFIQDNDTSGVECGFSGVLQIDPQDFGVGNGGGDADNVVVDPACHLIGDASP